MFESIESELYLSTLTSETSEPVPPVTAAVASLSWGASVTTSGLQPLAEESQQESDDEVENATQQGSDSQA